MFSCRFYLFCLVSILYISLCAGSSSNVKKCVETERQALLKFKASLIDEKGILYSWQGEDCCKWEGITCDNSTGHVSMLDLQGNYTSEFRGKIDSSLCELQHLTSLNLSANNLQGNIPKCIGSLSKLIVLKLAYNELVSPIPHTLGNLSNLQILDLGDNEFLVSNDLQWVSHLSSLRHLDLSFVNLSQAFDWPSSISKLSSLMVLRLYACGLKSKDWGFNVSKVLTELDLSYNELEGSIPKSLQRLCQLKRLYLSHNKLSGNLNDSIQYLCSTHNGIEDMDISDNPFNGSFPDVSKLSSLKFLNLRNTSIHGSLPQSLGHFPYLEALDLSHNQLSGPLSSLGQLPHLETLYLSHNQLSGPLSSLGQLPHLEALDLSHNQLSGSLSFFEVKELASLEKLDLSYNQLNGTLPYNIGKLSNLYSLSLQIN